MHGPTTSTAFEAAPELPALPAWPASARGLYNGDRAKLRQLCLKFLVLMDRQSRVEDTPRKQRLNTPGHACAIGHQLAQMQARYYRNSLPFTDPPDVVQCFVDYMTLLDT